MKDKQFGPCSPFLIVSKIQPAVDFYVQELGFDCRYLEPEEEPFFAIVNRGSAQIMLKEINESVLPVPNSQRHEWAAWDVFVFVDEPDQLATEFETRKVAFREPISTRDDGLRGFEIADPDGYVSFFGKPI